MAYADYEFYQTKFYGELIPVAQWNHFAMRADAYLDTLTFGRLAQGAAVTDAVRRAVCAAADVYAQCDAVRADMPTGIKSENTDGYSVTYADAAQLAEVQDAQLRAAVDLYLPKSDPLRYRGVRYGM
ncbi:MAG: hypothetical protein RSD27_10150 [Ruthenibacterium sp.]